MSAYRLRSTVNSSGSRARSSIRRTIFFSTLGLVIVALGLTSVVLLLVFSRTSRSLIEAQAREINQQIVFNYERYITGVISAADYLQLAVSTIDVASSRSELESIFFLNKEISADIVSIFLFDNTGRALAGSRTRPVPAIQIADRRWFGAAWQRPEIYHFSVGRSANTQIDRNDRVISVARRVNYLSGGRQIPGILLLELGTESITDLAEKTNLGEFGHILIIDDTDNLVYTSDDGPYAQASLAVAAQTFLGGFATRLRDQEVYIHTNTLIQTRWRIVTVGNIGAASASVRQVLALIAMIGALSLVLTAVVAALISLRISRPIDHLKEIMARIESGDLHSAAVVSGQQEIVQLSHSFNRMVIRVRELMERLVTEQREKRKTELRALQNQINPHFLYNTLDSIVWLAEHERSDDVVTTVVALAKFFRIGISRGETFIPVQQEIEHIKSYLTIQSIRYVDKFEYSIQIAPEIEQHRVMKLILQPLVENAIYHGMGDETGWISITGGLERDHLVFDVSNGGYGLTAERIAEIRKTMAGRVNGAGVGLRNVYQRLKLYYGERADVRVDSVMDESTCVRLIIPTTVPDAAVPGGL